MTRRLYYEDSYLTEFRTRVPGNIGDPCRVVLEETAFYPSSGGQPFDLGTINGIEVIDVLDSEDGIVHVLAGPVASADGIMHGRIDWARRFDHMQQHTGQHLLSAVIVDLFGVQTVGFHMGAESSTIELGAPAFDAKQIRAAEDKANQIIIENRPVAVSYLEAGQAANLRKPSEREGVL